MFSPYTLYINYGATGQQQDYCCIGQHQLLEIDRVLQTVTKTVNVAVLTNIYGARDHT